MLKGLISCADYQREHPKRRRPSKRPRPTRMVPPRYPKEAKKAKLEGRVVLEVAIGGRRVVAGVKVVESVPGSTQPPIASVREWEFAPALDCEGTRSPPGS
jgi:outer membrane biosynthesis protein TonB